MRAQVGNHRWGDRKRRRNHFIVFDAVVVVVQFQNYETTEGIRSLRASPRVFYGPDHPGSCSEIYSAIDERVLFAIFIQRNSNSKRSEKMQKRKRKNILSNQKGVPIESADSTL